MEIKHCANKLTLTSLPKPTCDVSVNMGYGYLLKNTNKNELIKTIRKVASGEKCFPTINIKNDKTKLFLTPRELDIFKLVLQEFTSQQIAEKFSLSLFTVNTHRKNIIKKTGVKNIAGLVKFAIDNNIKFEN